MSDEKDLIKNARGGLYLPGQMQGIMQRHPRKMILETSHNLIFRNPKVRCVRRRRQGS